MQKGAEIADDFNFRQRLARNTDFCLIPKREIRAGRADSAGKVVQYQHLALGHLASAMAVEKPGTRRHCMVEAAKALQSAIEWHDQEIQMSGWLGEDTGH